MSDPAILLDKMYRWQRYIYDATRKFYLLGRDDLIAGLAPPPGGSVLELGCGTGRNLVKVAQRFPLVTCYGVDASVEMLTTAQSAIQHAGLQHRILLTQGDAVSFDPEALFGRRDFDRIFISYALSMIPPRAEVLAHAGDLLAPNGALHIVDFGNLAGLPAWFRVALTWWLALFHVVPCRTLPTEVADFASSRQLQHQVRYRFRGYAVQALIKGK